MPKSACIGKKGPPEYPDRMYPNERYQVYFPDSCPPPGPGDREGKSPLETATFKREQIYRLLGVTRALYEDLSFFLKENAASIPEDFRLPEVPESWTRGS